jgi:16S rRNA processing protein RimM
VEPDTDSPALAIARIVRTRGNRGEVLADILTDFPERFERLKTVLLEFPDQHRETAVLEETWAHKGRQVLKFAGIESISEAERLRAAWVLVDLRDAVPLEEGEYYDHDLVGCRVVDVAGAVLGTVREILKAAGNAVLIVDGPRGEILIPAVADFCRHVSVADKTIVVDLPEGLLDLNR